jgi:hypothetical protein
MTQNRFATAYNRVPADLYAAAPAPAAFIACPPALMPGLAMAGPGAFVGIYGIYQEAYRRACQEVQARVWANGNAEPRRGNVFAIAPAKPLA